MCHIFFFIIIIKTIIEETPTCFILKKKLKKDRERISSIVPVTAQVAIITQVVNTILYFRGSGDGGGSGIDNRSIKFA